MKILILVFSFFSLAPSAAFASFKWQNTAAIDTLSGNVLLNGSNLYLERGSGDQGTDSNPYKVFIPFSKIVSSSDTADEAHNYTFLGTGSTSSTAAAYLSTIAASSLAIKTLYQPVDTDPRSAYLALKMSSGSDYKVVAVLATGLSTSAQNTDFSAISITTLCGQNDPLTDFTCNLDADVPGTRTTTSAIGYLFDALDSAGIGINSTLTTSSQPGGIFIQFNFSDNYKHCSGGTGATEVPQITGNRIGDTNVSLFFNGSSINHVAGNLFYRAVGLQLANSTSAAATTPRKALGFLTGKGVFDANLNATSGALSLTGLANDVPVFLSAMLINKYQFASCTSQTVALTPLEIASFLQEESCYLVAAGFKESHPTLSYFRSFRDEVLAHHPLGSAFITWYYRTAPQYAQKIFASPWASRWGRSFFSGLSQVMQLFWVAKAPPFRSYGPHAK